MASLQGKRESAPLDDGYRFQFSFRKFMRFMGPGWVMSLAYLDPGNLEADLQQGAYTNYNLLWVLWWSTVAGLMVQELCSRLCIVTGMNLAEAAGAKTGAYSPVTSYLLYAMMELAIIGSDIQEVVGSAIAFHLLFGWPLWFGCIVTGLDSFTFLLVYHCGVRYFEGLISLLILIIASCFFYNFSSVSVTSAIIIEGLVIPKLRKPALMQAMGTLGAVIMPHNLYLHSGLVKSRMKDFNRSDEASTQDAVTYSFLESALALLVSFFINLAVVGTFANFFYSSKCASQSLACVPVSGEVGTTATDDLKHCTNDVLGSSVDAVCAEIGLDEAGDALEVALGPLGVLAWAIGLLAAGQASTMSTTIAGQVVMDGFLDLKLNPWQRATVTRLAALGPSIIIAVSTSDDAALRNSINEWLNILQSIQLPFAIIPTLTFTASAFWMGDRFRNRGYLFFISCGLILLVLGCNVFLVADFISTHPTTGYVSAILAGVAGCLYFAFIVVLLFAGSRIIRTGGATGIAVAHSRLLTGGAANGYGAVPATETPAAAAARSSREPHRGYA
jgi:NRAMP (natural resistance-associated macrophage protein)-like metal ion transporter